jgi:hypothetical protein
MDDVVQYVNALPPATVVLVGGTRGVDRAAAGAAKARGLAVQRDLPDWSTGTRAVYTGSDRLVQEADRVVVFRAGGSPSTMYTIRAAVQAGKPTRVFSPDWAPFPDGLPGEEYPSALPPSRKTA